jgi:hypothetical protein
MGAAFQAIVACNAANLGARMQDLPKLWQDK